MDDRIMQFRVGVMVLATIIVTGILLVVLGEVPQFGLTGGTYTLHIQFPQAPGVAKDTPVRKSGILIGRVTDVRFADDSSVVVSAAIRDNVKLGKHERAQIKGGLLGDAVIEFVPGAVPQQRVTYADGDQVPKGVVVRDPVEMLSDFQGDMKVAIRTVNDAGERIGVAGDKIGQLANNLNRLIEQNDEQLHRVLDETEKALKGFNRTIASLERIAGDEKIQDGLRQSLQDLPATLDQSRKTFEKLQKTISLADENLENLRSFTGPLGKEGEVIVKRVSGSVDKLDELLGQVVSLIKTINSESGSLGQLLKNPDLYQSLYRSSKNIEDATSELRPLLRHARVFMQKVAQHPGLPVRDAIRPQPGLTE